MKITRRQLRRLISEEFGKIPIHIRQRGDNDRAGYTSGLYEDDDSESLRESDDIPPGGRPTNVNDVFDYMGSLDDKLDSILKILKKMDTAS